MSREEFILQLRGGGIENWVAAFGIIIAIITLINNVDAFQIPPNPGAMILPHLQWLYRNQQPGNHFRYGKETDRRSITILGAGSEKKEPSNGSWDYMDVMTELKNQSKKKLVDIEVGAQMYTVQNPYRQSADKSRRKLRINHG